MNFKAEKTENANEMKLEFTVDAKIFEEGIQKVFKKSAQYFNIPGFRKGKAPYHIVEKTYGKEMFYEDAFNEVVPAIYDEEIQKNNIEVVSRPEIDIVQIEKGKDLIFTAIVQVKPEVELGKYEGIEVKKVEYNVKDEEIDAKLTEIAERNSRLVSIDDRAVQAGDITIIDYKGTVDGVAFDGGTAEGFELEIGSKSFIEGFEDQMIGMKIDEEKDLNVTFPEEYFSKEMAGKEAVFKVIVHEIKVKEIPAIDDELAKDASEYETLEELKASIKEDLEVENNKKAKREMEDEAIKKIVENAKFEIPSGMVENEIDMRIKAFENNLYYQGMNMDNYLKMINQTMEDLRAQMKDSAAETVKLQVILEAVAEDLGDKLVVNEEKVNAEVEKMAVQYGKKAEELKENEEYMKYVTKNQRVEDTVEYIMSKAKVK